MIKKIHVAGVILFSQQKILLGKRKSSTSYPNLLEIPGGKIEPGESIIEAAHREIFEELEIQMSNVKPFLSLTWTNPTIQITLSSVTGYAIQHPKKSNDHSELYWISPSFLPIYIKYNYQQITKPDIPILEVFGEQFRINPEYFNFSG